MYCTQSKSRPCATLSTACLACTVLGLKRDFRSEKPAPSCLRYRIVTLYVRTYILQYRIPTMNFQNRHL
jgi:hypothetical protein